VLDAGCAGRFGFLVVGRAGLVVFVGVRQPIRLRHAVSRLRLGPWSGGLFKPAVASTGRGASRGNPLAALGLRAKAGPPRWWPRLNPAFADPSPRDFLRLRSGQTAGAAALWPVGPSRESLGSGPDAEERGRVAPFALGSWFFHSEKERKAKINSQEPNPALKGTRGYALACFLGVRPPAPLSSGVGPLFQGSFLR
jgi:hypothetical protein